MLSIRLHHYWQHGPCYCFIQDPIALPPPPQLFSTPLPSPIQPTHFGVRSSEPNLRTSVRNKQDLRSLIIPRIFPSGNRFFSSSLITSHLMITRSILLRLGPRPPALYVVIFWLIYQLLLAAFKCTPPHLPHLNDVGIDKPSASNWLSFCNAPAAADSLIEIHSKFANI